MCWLKIQTVADLQKNFNSLFILQVSHDSKFQLRMPSLWTGVRVVSSCTSTQRNETLTNCVTTPCMDMKTIGIPPCTGTSGQPQSKAKVDLVMIQTLLLFKCKLLCYHANKILVSITTWSPSASLQIKSLATKYTTVKWLIKSHHLSDSVFTTKYSQDCLSPQETPKSYI